MSQAISGSSSGGGPSGGGSSKRAPRGAACLNCRRRKMRCDGGRPVCGQCVRTNREYDCEYTDGPGLSPTQALEEQIARLEARIREIEHPELIVPSITLNPTQGQTAPQAPAGLVASPMRAIVSRVGTPDFLPFIAPGAVGPSSPALSQDPAVQPPIDLVRSLVNAFLPHSTSLNFFLQIPRFMQALQLPAGDPRRAQLSPALLNAVYLWGAHLSTTNAIRTYEATFLARATSALSSALRDSHYTVMNLIQAEVLVANYFFTMSRFLEGRYHCSAAVALALSCRLGKIRSSADQGVGFGQAGRDNILPPPRDAIEEGERIRSFWYVYALDKTWAVALGSPSHFNGVVLAQTGSHVDTPWPLEMAQYEAGGMPPNYRSSTTVYSFISGAPSQPYGGRDSSLSYRAKAATLFERATYVASQWTATTDRNEFYGRFMVLDTLIDRFTASLPPVERASSPDAALNALVTHTLARAATIQLRSSFKDYDRMNDRKDFAAAQAATALLDHFNNIATTNIDPILAILWTAVSRVLIGEILRLDASHAASSQLVLSHPTYASVAASSSSRAQPLQLQPQPQPEPQTDTQYDAILAALAQAASAGSRSPQRDAVRALLDKVLNAMHRFRDASPLMGMIRDGLVSLQGAM